MRIFSAPIYMNRGQFIIAEQKRQGVHFLPNSFSINCRDNSMARMVP